MATSIGIAIDCVIGHRIAALPTLFAIAGVGLPLVACANLVVEARTGLRSNDMEVRSFHELERYHETAEVSTSHGVKR